MASLILVDTDVLIDAGRNRAEATTALQRLAEDATLAISIVTEMELVVGCRNKAELRVVDRFARRFRIEPLTAAISTLAAGLLRRYRLSHRLLIADALIAAGALVLDAPFLTKNQRDYRFIDGLKVLPYP